MTSFTVTIAGRDYPVRAAIYDGRLVDLGTAIELLKQAEPQRQVRHVGRLKRLVISVLTFG